MASTMARRLLAHTAEVALRLPVGVPVLIRVFEDDAQHVDYVLIDREVRDEIARAGIQRLEEMALREVSRRADRGEGLKKELATAHSVSSRARVDQLLEQGRGRHDPVALIALRIERPPLVAGADIVEPGDVWSVHLRLMAAKCAHKRSAHEADDGSDLGSSTGKQWVDGGAAMLAERHQRCPSDQPFDGPQGDLQQGIQSHERLVYGEFHARRFQIRAGFPRNSWPSPSK